MIVGAQQPCFLPWVGYWHKLLTVDVLVDMPFSQMEKGDYFNRVTLEGRWLTLPVAYTFGDTVAETQLAREAAPALKKMVKTLEMKYGKHLKFYRIEPLLVAMLAWTEGTGSLAAFNNHMRGVLGRAMGIDVDKKVIVGYSAGGKTTESRLMNMLIKTVPCMTEYRSGAAGLKYIRNEWPVPVKYQKITQPYGGDSVIKLLVTEDDPVQAILNAGSWYSL